MIIHLPLPLMITPKEQNHSHCIFSIAEQKKHVQPSEIKPVLLLWMSAVPNLQDRLSASKPSPVFQAVILSTFMFLDERWECEKMPCTETQASTHMLETLWHEHSQFLSFLLAQEDKCPGGHYRICRWRCIWISISAPNLFRCLNDLGYPTSLI